MRIVADVSVMLALMAGRITGELTDLVKSGGVRFSGISSVKKRLM